MPPTQERSLDELLAHEEPLFRRAVHAVITADPTVLEHLLDTHPHLIHERSASAHRASLLHFIASNGIESGLQLSSASVYQSMQRCEGDRYAEARQRILSVLDILLQAGAEVDALCETYGGGRLQTTLNLLVSSDHLARAGVQCDLVERLIAAGAKIDGLDDDSSPLLTALAFGFPLAARTIVKCGAKIDNLVLAAAANDLDQVRAYLAGQAIAAGDLARCSLSWLPMPEDPRVAAELALVFACMCGHEQVVRLLLDAGVNIDAIPPGSHMTGSPLQTACLIKQVDIVRLLIDAGADPTQKDPRYDGTVADWALEGGSEEILRMIRQYVPQYKRVQEGSRPEIQAFIAAVFSADTKRLRQVLAKQPLTPEQLDGPWFHFDAPAVVQAKSNLPMIDVLLEAGADINKKSEWWAGGFGVLDETRPRLAKKLIRRGAVVDVWAAAGLGKMERLRQLIHRRPELVHARGGDGKTPLHCARNVKIAKFLLRHGAEIDARDIDHESTPAQHLVAERPQVARYLVRQGCQTDIMLAAALGDESLVRRFLRDDPQTIRTTIDRNWFPTSAADCIYCWTLGWYLTPHQVASKFRRRGVLRLLLKKSPPDVKLVNACLLSLPREISKCLSANPNVLERMGEGERKQIAHAARNNQRRAVRLMLQAGFPVDAVGQHGATPLHWAAFHGNAKMVRDILTYNPPLEVQDADFQATPLGWAREGCQHGWHRGRGDYPATVELLLRAGCQIQDDWPATEHAGVDQVFESFRR